MNQPLFCSIIVPLYNCEDLLPSFIERLNDQTFTNFEVIFVDDGSSDHTMDALALNLKNAVFSSTVIQQKNSGPGVARNTGIPIAKGRYLLFLDSDDYLESNAMQILHDRALEINADVLLFGYFQDFYNASGTLSHSVAVVPERQNITDASDVIRYAALLDEKKVFSFACNKAVKKELICDNGLHFSDLRHSEDYFFYIELFAHVKSVLVLDQPLYHYVKSLRVTLTNQSYLHDFYELIIHRYRAMRAFLMHANMYYGAPAEAAANVHIKHIFSYFSNNFAPESGMTGNTIRLDIKKVLQDELTKEALKWSSGHSLAGKIMNSVLHTQNVWLCYFFSRLIHSMKNNKIFDQLK